MGKPRVNILCVALTVNWIDSDGQSMRMMMETVGKGKQR
jgi:hypothetical protein